MMKEYAEKRRDAVEHIREARYTWAPRAMYALAVLLVCLVGAVTLQLINPFESGFIVNTLATLLPSFVVFVSFTITFKWKEMAESDLYHSWNVKWTEQSNRVRDAKMQGAFVKYCEKKTAEERMEIFRNRLENALITLEEYEDKYSKMTSKDLAEEKKAGRVGAKQYRVIKSLRKPIEVKPVQPMLILRGVDCHSVNDAGRDAGGEMSWRFVSRIVCSVASVLASSAIMPTIGENFEFLPYITTLVVRLVSITTSAFAGAYNGIDIVSGMCQKMKVRTAYIENFLEECE